MVEATYRTIRAKMARGDGALSDALGAAGLFGLLVAGLHLPVFA